VASVWYKHVGMALFLCLCYYRPVSLSASRLRWFHSNYGTL